MIVDRPIVGVRVLKAFWTMDRCAEVVEQLNSRSDWRPAAIGRYQNDEVVESSVDKTFRDVEVLNLDATSVGNPFVERSGFLDFVNDEFQCGATRISRSMAAKYSLGSHIRPHKDTGSFDTSRLVTLVLYLNDNYSGGELYFPDLQMSMRPDTGSIIAFYSEFRHGVMKIVNGYRYCVVGFAENEIAYRKS